MSNKDFETLEDLTPDDKNPNKGTARGAGLLETSLRRLGAGRSILADKNGKLIAGNKTHERAVELGLGARFVRTKGDDVVVVIREDLDLDTDPQARELSIADNRVGEVSLEWDADVLRQLSGDALKNYWKDDELAELLRQ